MGVLMMVEVERCDGGWPDWKKRIDGFEWTNQELLGGVDNDRGGFDNKSCWQ